MKTILVVSNRLFVIESHKSNETDSTNIWSNLDDESRSEIGLPLCLFFHGFKLVAVCLTLLPQILIIEYGSVFVIIDLI